MRTATGLKSVSLFFAAAAVMGLNAQLSASQRLLNPGFEAPPSASTTDELIAAWNPIGQGMVRATFAKNNGNYGLWLKTFELIGGGAMQEAVVVPSTPYNFSAWAKYEAGFTSQDATTVDMKVEWLDSGGGTISSDGINITPQNAGSVVGSANEWHQLTLNNLTAPASAAKARVSFGWDFGNIGAVNPQSFFFDDILFDGAGPNLGGAIWLNNASGDWNIDANWSSGTVPNGIGVEAQLLGVITSPRTLYSDTAITLGSLIFDNTNTYVVSGAGALTMDVASGTNTFTVVKGSHKINLPLTLNDNTVANISPGATLTIADPLTQANGSSLTVTGGGTLNIISTVNNTANASLIVNNGTINAELDLGNRVTVTASTGTVNLNATQHLNGITGAGGKVNLANGKKLIRTNSVAMSGTGQLNLADGRLIIDYTVTPPLASIRTQITSGRAGGAWNGPGINSSAAAADSRLAIGSAVSSVIGVTSFAGESVDSTTLLVATTLKGDANLNFTVNFDDLLIVAQNYGGTSKIWTTGDLDYNGTVNFDDLLGLAQTYGATYLADGSIVQDSAMAANFDRDWAFALSIVPEPATLGLLMGGLIVLARRRP